MGRTERALDAGGLVALALADLRLHVEAARALLVIGMERENWDYVLAAFAELDTPSPVTDFRDPSRPTPTYRPEVARRGSDQWTVGEVE